MKPAETCRMCGGASDQGSHGYLVCISDGEIPAEEENRLADRDQARTPPSGGRTATSIEELLRHHQGRRP